VEAHLASKATGEQAMSQILEGIEVAEFNQLLNRFIEREAPDAISFDALDEAVHQRLGEVTTTQEAT
jgi:hypothetical protein